MTRYCSQCGNEFEPSQPHHAWCWDCWHAEHGTSSSPRRDNRSVRLDADVISDAIQLCHPDRHPADRYDLANRTTARLLQLRDQLRSAA